MNKYIELHRTFVPCTEKEDFDPDSDISRYRFGFKATGWPELLDLPRVVILAEAGTGKTEEFKAVARKLRDEGKAAFFCAIEELAEEGIERALPIGEDAAYKEWLLSENHAWFFLDSVDEARLANSQFFERALKKLARELDAAAKRARIFISARVSDWHATADLLLVEGLLPPPPQEKRVNSSEPTEEDSAASITDNAAIDTTPQIHIYRLAPLNLEQRRQFAAGQGVSDVNSLMDALERADAESFAERPQDLLDLVTYWQNEGKIGSHEEMIDYNISKKLTETNRKHGDKQLLSPEKARIGAETIAAALTLSRRSTVVLPDQPVDPQRAAHSVDAKELLPDWAAKDVNTLLGRALFDEALYGRVRIHHRSVREYLTTMWLNRLLRTGRKRRAAEDLIFASWYGIDVVIPSMSPIAAWLALKDERICNRLGEIAPEVLIAHGDPSRLPLDVRRRLLKRFAEVHEQRKYNDEPIDLSAVRRLADPQLAETVNTLLQQYQKNEDIRHLLLRMIWQGEMKDCADIALSFALDPDMDRYSRVGGIRAVSAAGDERHKRHLVDALLSDVAGWGRTLAGEIGEFFFPQFLSLDELLKILERVDPSERYYMSSMNNALEVIIRERCPRHLQLPLLQGLVRLIRKKPQVNRRHCTISKRYSWLLEHAASLAYCLLENKGATHYDESILRTIEVTCQGHHYDLGTRQSTEQFQSIIDRLPDLRCLLFWRVVARKRAELGKANKRLTEWWEARGIDAPWTLKTDDFDYFLGQISKRQHLDNRLVALSAAFFLWESSGKGKVGRAKLTKAVRGISELEARLYQYLHPGPMTPEQKEHRRFMRNHESRQAQRLRNEEQQRKEWVIRLQANPERLRRVNKTTVDKLFGDLYGLGQEIKRFGKNELKLGSPKWKLLIADFGNEVAEAVRDGLMAYWRLYKPDLKSENNANAYPYGLIVGLIGLAIEAHERPEWAQHLSSTEALLAARYATREINGLPSWAPALLAAQTDAMDEIMERELLWEFKLPAGAAPAHHMLSSLRYGPEALRLHYSPYILSLLQKSEPVQSYILGETLSILLRWPGLDTAAFTGLAKERCTSAKEEEKFLTWLVAWMCVDATSALVALDGWISEPRVEAEKDQRMIRFCDMLIDRRNLRFGSVWRDFERIEILRDLVPLVYSRVRIEDDAVHEGVYSPDARDDAETTRGYLLEKVCNTPGRASFEALMDFSSVLPHERSRERMAVLARRRAAADAEQEPWKAIDIVSFARELEKQPHTGRDLFELVCGRLDEIKCDLDDGDFSEAGLVQKAADEIELRNWFASRLRLTADSKYTVSPEEELADATRPDVRVHAPQVASPVVIELKISDKWTFSEHVDRLHKQLVGQYLRDARSQFGVFLLVWNGKKKGWRAKKGLNFVELVERLQVEANSILHRRYDLEDIRVIGIDLTKRATKKVFGRVTKKPGMSK